MGEHIWGQFLVDKLVEQLSAAKSFYSGFFQLFDYWLLGGEDDWFGFSLHGEWDIDFSQDWCSPLFLTHVYVA